MTLQRWEQRAEVPLVLVAVAFLVAYAVPIIWPGVASPVFGYVITASWVIFAFDYVVRLAIAPAKLRFMRSNLIDLAVIALPLLRPLRLLRLIALISVLNRTGSRSLRGRVATYATGGAVLLLFVGALAIADAERGKPGASITGFGDGLWWAITTMTTVGYGDKFPVSITGRCVAAALMVGGVALLGIVTATVASWLVEAVAESDERDARAIESLREEIAALRAIIEAQMTSPVPTSGADPSARPLSGTLAGLHG